MDVQAWQDEIEKGLDYRRKYAKEDLWPELERAFYNDKGSIADTGPNLIFSEGDTILSSLTYADPEFLISADDFQSVESAPIVESLANRLSRPEHLNIKSVVDEAWLNSYLYSLAIVKIGYDSEFGWDPRFDLGTFTMPFGASRTQFAKDGSRLEYKNIKPGYPWISSVLPHDIVVPWGSGPNVDDLPWIAHRVIRANAKIKKDAKYKNTKRLEPQISMQQFVESYQTSGRMSRRGAMRKPIASAVVDDVIFNELWEIHDRENQEIIVISFDYSDFLRKQRDPIQQALKGCLPFVAGSLVRRSRCFWAPPLSYYMIQHQVDLKDTHIQAGKQRRLNVARFLMQGGVLDQTEEDKLISGDVGAFAKTKPGIKNLSDVVAKFPSVSNTELYYEASVIRRNAREVSGFSSNQAGEFDTSSRRTATESMLVGHGASTRVNPKQAIVKTVYSESMRKALELTFAFWKTPRQILVGQDWQQFTGAQLNGRYSYYTNLVEKSTLTKAQRTAQAIQMIGVLSQFPNINIAAAEAFIVRAVNDPGFTGFFPAPNQQQGLLLPPGGGQQPAQQSAPQTGIAD